MKTNMNAKNCFSILLASALALCGGAAWAKGASDPVLEELASIFDCANTATTVAPIKNVGGETIGRKVVLGTNYGPLAFSNDFGAVTIDLNGWSIKGVDGASGTDKMAGTDGGPAIVVDGECGSAAGETALAVTYPFGDGSGKPIGLASAKGDAMIVDLTPDSNGKFPVVFYENVDFGLLNCDVYKTTKIALRKFKRGESHLVRSRDTPMTPVKDYYMGIFEVTEAQYARVMGLDSSLDSKLPKHGVSYNEIRSGSNSVGLVVSPLVPVGPDGFMGKLCAKCVDARTGDPIAGFDLPTCIQWEIAAVGDSANTYGDAIINGVQVPVYNGGNLDNVCAVAQNTRNCYRSYRAVGGLAPNPFGLYDTIGNAAEFCRDGRISVGTDVETPAWSWKDESRFVAGGDTWYTPDSYCLPISTVFDDNCDNGDTRFGFRLSLTWPAGEAPEGEVRPDFGSVDAVLAGGNGGDGNLPGKGAFAIVDGNGAEVSVANPAGLVKKGEDGEYLKSPTQVALEGIFDTANTPTVIELMHGADGAFAGYKVILGKDYGPLAFSNDFGKVTINLNGWVIKGADGATGSVEAGGTAGGAAITIDGACGSTLGATAIAVTNDVTIGGVQLWENGPFFAECNVGATKPEECGYYFWWGDTVGYTNNGSAWLSVVDGTTSITFNNESTPASSTFRQSYQRLEELGYISDAANPVLNAAHDAATAHFGAPWRMMTDAELLKFYDQTTSAVCEWIWDGARKGYTVKGKGAYSTKSVFLPAAGEGSGSGIINSNIGYYWSSTPSPDRDYYAWSLYFNSSGTQHYDLSRYYGHLVRPVRDDVVSRAGIFGGKGGDGIIPGNGSEAIVNGSGEKVEVEDALGVVKKGAEGLPYVAQIVTAGGAAAGVFTSLQAAFDSELLDNPAVTNTVKVLQDVALQGPIGLPICDGEGGLTNATARLDLNGKTITVPTGAALMTVASGATVIIDDTSAEGTGVIEKADPIGGFDLTAMIDMAVVSVFEGGKLMLANGTLKSAPEWQDEAPEGQYDSVGVVNYLGEFLMTGGAIIAKDSLWPGNKIALYGLGENVITGGKVKDAILYESYEDITSMSISGGVFGTSDVFDHPDWVAEGYACDENADAATFAEGYKWAVFFATDGSKWKPWNVGPEGSELPQAYTNCNGELVIEGAGTVVEKPWLNDGMKENVNAITVKNPETELPEGAFEGMGSDDAKIKIVLPDNWKGDLPDESGNWYGGKVKITTWPYIVRNVKFQQRYPWNGLVDITADVYGPEDMVLLKVSASNGAEILPVMSFEDNQNFTVELTNGLTRVKLVWNADKDMGRLQPRLTDVRVKVTQAPLDAAVDTAVLVERTEPGVTLDENCVVVGAMCDGNGYLEIPIEAKGLAKGVLANQAIKLVNFLSCRTEINLHAWDKSGFSATDVPTVQVEGSVPSAYYRDNVSAYANIGTAIAYHWLTGVNRIRSVPLSKLEQSDESEAGRLDLRDPIIVAPGESDEITYSVNQWGEHAQDGTVNIHFGTILAESREELNALPVVIENLTGEGKAPFTYPEKTGSYMFMHKYVPPANANKMALTMVKQVFVVWYVGADDPKSVYAMDRGDGEIYVMGDGYMKDFTACGPWGTDITGVNVGSGVRNVGANAFKGCTKMTHVELPESMEMIGNGAFAGDTGLESIGCEAVNPPWFSRDPFKDVSKEGVVVYVPDDTIDEYENSEYWAPFWSRSMSEGEDFYFEVYAYAGVSRKVTVNGEVVCEGTDYYDGYIPYGSKVEVTATIADERYLFDDGSKEKSFTWNFLTVGAGVYDEIMPYGADWLVLQRALAGAPLADLRGALEYENENGTNVITLLRDVSSCSQYDRTLVVTNAAVLDLAGHAARYGNGEDGVIGVGASYWEAVPVQRQKLQASALDTVKEGQIVKREEGVEYQEERRYLPAWLNIVDTVGGGAITKSGGTAKLATAGILQAPRRQFYYGGGVTVLPGSTCIMDGGTITSCYGTEAGGVYNAGTFVLTGGEIIGNVADYDPDGDGDGIVNMPGAELVVTGGKVRDGIYNWRELSIEFIPPAVEISGGYFGTAVTLDRAWIADGYEPIPSAEFVGYDKQVIQTPPEVARAREEAWEEIEKKAGLPMTRSDEMDDLVEEAREHIRDAYPVANIETALAAYLSKVVDQYAKDNPGVPQTLTATGTLDLRSRRELPYEVDVVEGITYSDSTWGRDATPGAVTIAQRNLETGETMNVVEGQWGTSEGTSVQLVGQDTPETGLGHKLFHAVRGTILESFVTFVFSGFERGCPSNPWDAGEPDVEVYVDDDPEADPAPGKKLVIDGDGELDPSDEGVAWNDRRAEITEIFVASGIVLKASALAGYPNLQRIVFEDPNYRLPNNVMNEYYDDGRNEWIYMTWPSDGVYVLDFNTRRKVTAFYDESGVREDYLDRAYDAGFDPVVFSTVPADLISIFPDGTPFEPITDENGDLRGWKVTLEDDIYGTVSMPDNLGWIVIDLNGHDVRGRDGYWDAKSQKNGNGRPAFSISSAYEDGEPLVLEFIDSKPDELPDVVGGKGVDGNPAGFGAPAISIGENVLEGVKVIAGAGVIVKGGDAGAGLGVGVSPGEPGSYGEPEALVEAIEGGKVEYGDEAEGDVTAWAKCSLGTTPPASWMRELPQGLSYANGEFWFWRRVGDKTGPATFDFNELPLELIASAGITSVDIQFVPGTIEVDTIKAPISFGFRFVGSEGRMPYGPIVKSATKKDEKEDDEERLPVIVIGGKTTLVAVSGKSIFELAGETGDADSVVTWENLEFTCREEYAEDRWGGAIRMEGGAMRIVNCTFADCFADDYGGAIFAFGLERDSSIVGCRFENCFADGMYGYGGAIYASSMVVGHAEADARVRLTVSSSTFVGNGAVNGGAICTMRDANVDDLINEQPIELEILQVSFLENAAEYDGGAIFAEGPVTITGTPQGGSVPVVIDPTPVKPIVVGAVRPTSFYRNFAGGSGGAIAMDCVVGDWFVPAKLSVGEGAEFVQNLASNAYTYALGGAIAHLQPGGELEIYGAKFLDNKAIATGGNESLAYALGGAVYAGDELAATIEKTRFFGNWAVSENAYAYGGAMEFPANNVVKVTACSFDDNGAAGLFDWYGGALDFGGAVRADVRNSTFRGSNIEAVNAYEASVTLTNCVAVGNGTLNEVEGDGVYSDVYATDSAMDVAWTAYGSYFGEGTSPVSFDDAANHNLPASTIDIYDPAEGAEPWLCPTGYVAAAAQGLVQDATDVDGVAYGSRFWGYSMGAYECHTMRDMSVGIVVTIDPEEYAWTGAPIEPHAPVRVYDTIVGSNLVEGVDYTLTWSNNIDPTDRAVVTAIGTERDYIFSAFTNFWITAYYVDSYKDDETEPFLTEMFGELSHSNVAARIVPPAGYAYDPLTSMPTGTVRRYDGECPFPRNGQLTLVVHYVTDEGGDEIPDIYQKKMHLKVVNGWWNGEQNGADKTYWVTLYDAEGKWSAEGTGRLGENTTNRAESIVLATAGQRPFTDYAASGKWWYMFDSTEFSKIDTPAGLEVRSGSWPFVIFLYDREQADGGRGGRGGRGSGGSSALAEYKLRAGLRIAKFAYADGMAAGEARASVVDESTGQTILDELLRRTKVNVLATESLESGDWSVIGSPTTDGEGGWSAGEGAAAETPAQMFYKLQLR